MRSVADALRRDNVTRVLAMNVRERIALALTLGRRDIDAYARSTGISRAEARRRLSLRRHDGRVPSRAAMAEPWLRGDVASDMQDLTPHAQRSWLSLQSEP